MCNIEEQDDKYLCYFCIEEKYLREKVQRDGVRARCSYCAREAESYSIEMLADLIGEAFMCHYYQTSDQLHSWQQTRVSDREPDYGCERDGEPVVNAIIEAAQISEEAAEDVQKTLEEKYYDFDAAATGEETEFSEGSYYKVKNIDDRAWKKDWLAFEHSMKTETRFFNRIASHVLVSVFENISDMVTSDGKPLVVSAGPTTQFSTFYRARMFQSVEDLKEALCRPDQQLSPPPAHRSRAGRMNAQGISVFYGASDPAGAIAEVRPPVGSKVVVARFDVIRPLHLLDLTALKKATENGSIFDPGFSKRLERAEFLRSLSQKMILPVMPNDEALEYLPTQAIADFLAVQTEQSIDGILFPSVQAGESSLNIMLFHKAARVERTISPNSRIEVSCESLYEEEEEGEWEYNVTEYFPSKSLQKARLNNSADCTHDSETLDHLQETDAREITLRIDVNSITVHHAQRVIVKTDQYKVNRRRSEESPMQPCHYEDMEMDF